MHDGTVTADEDASSHGNRIPTVAAGAHVEAGTSGQRIDHYGLLRTLLDSFGIAPIAASGDC